MTGSTSWSDVPKTTLHDAGEYWFTLSEPDLHVTATVLVPTFNAVLTLERALASARNQTLSDIEIIVIDDASTDGSWAVIEAMMAVEPRLHAIRNKRNSGKPVSMNRAIDHARGRWLAVLDADDWYHPERLDRLIALAEAAGTQMAADNQVFYDAIACQYVGSAWAISDRCRRLTLDAYLAKSDAYERFSLGMLKPIFDAEFIRTRQILYESDARNGQDFFKLLRFFLAGGTAITTDVPYYYYTQPYGTTSRQWSHETRKRYDFHQAYTINQRYLAEQRDKLTPSQLALLLRRSSQLSTLEHFHRIRECLSRHDVLGAMSHAVARPGVITYCARQILRHWWRVAGPMARLRGTPLLSSGASAHSADTITRHTQPTA